MKDHESSLAGNIDDPSKGFVLPWCSDDKDFVRPSRYRDETACPCLYTPGDVLMVKHNGLNRPTTEPARLILVRILGVHPSFPQTNIYYRVEHLQSTPFRKKLEEVIGQKPNYFVNESELALPDYAAIEHRYE